MVIQHKQSRLLSCVVVLCTLCAEWSLLCVNCQMRRMKKASAKSTALRRSSRSVYTSDTLCWRNEWIIDYFDGVHSELIISLCACSSAQQTTCLLYKWHLGDKVLLIQQANSGEWSQSNTYLPRQAALRVYCCGLTDRCSQWDKF